MSPCIMSESVIESLEMVVVEEEGGCAVYLLHGTGGSPEGSVKHLEIELVKCGAQQNYVRPLLPHTK